MQLSLSSRDEEKDMQGTWDGIKRWVEKNVKISPYPNKIENGISKTEFSPSQWSLQHSS